MKTALLSIITGTGIAAVILLALIVVIMPSTLADQVGLSIGVEQNKVGVGEPISFFVEVSSQLQSSMYPTAVIVDEQNRTVWGDDDLPPNGYKGMTKVYYVQRYSENVPIINQTGKYVLIVAFGDKKTSKDLTVTGTIQENNMLHYYGAYTGIAKENTDIEIVDKPYYLTTIHKTPSDLTAPNDTTIQFHGVTFTFPGCGQCLPMPTVQNPSHYVNVQFKDKTNETLEIRDNQWSTIGPPMDFHEYLANGTKIFPNGTRGTWTPRFHMDPIVTVFSNHEYPQAGITVTHDSVKFLVSVENNSSQQYVNFGNTENSALSENHSKVSQLGNHWYGGGGPVVTITLDPLQQFKSGIAATHVICKQGLQLIFKAEDETPVCASPQTGTKLIHAGWAVQTLDSGKSWLKIDILNLNDTYTIGKPIVFSVNVKGFGYYPCVSPQVDVCDDKNPVVSIFHENGSTMSCPVLITPNNYSFDFPSKNDHYITSINKTGNYTVSILFGTNSVKKYFSIIPSLNSTTLITNSKILSIPQCVSSIQNRYAVAGPRGDPLCPVVNFQSSGKIVNYAGFYGVYEYPEYLGTTNFVLEPGHNGTLSYRIDIGSIYNWGNQPSANDVNITNGVEFMHDAGMHDHPGVTAMVSSQSEVIQKNDSAFVTITFAATKDARPGTYWVYLPPGFCVGGETIILTITDCKK